MKKSFYACLLTILMFGSAFPSVNSSSASPVSPTLLQSLQKGGYILYVRHGEATVGEDQPNVDFNDCSTQRNLSQKGREQAVQFGEALKRFSIPVQVPVEASPFCRTRETAELAFGKENVSTNPFWVRIYRLSSPVSPAEQENTLKALSSVLEKTPPSGTNDVIVAHSFPQGLGLGEITYLGAVVVKPKGEGKGYEIIGTLTLEQLMHL